jgi:hypothetical protein
MCYAVLCCTASCYAALFCAMRHACMPCCVGADEGLTDAQRAVMEPPYHGPVFTDRPLLNDDGQLDERSQKLIAEKGWDGIGGSLESDPLHSFLFLPFIQIFLTRKQAGAERRRYPSAACPWLRLVHDSSFTSLRAAGVLCFGVLVCLGVQGAILATRIRGLDASHASARQLV